MAVASAGPYASLHLAPDSSPPLSFFTGRMTFLPPNQQCQRTEGSIRRLYTDTAVCSDRDGDRAGSAERAGRVEALSLLHAQHHQPRGARVEPTSSEVPRHDTSRRRRRGVSVVLRAAVPVAESLACWTQVQKGPGSNRSRDAVGLQS